MSTAAFRFDRSAIEPRLAREVREQRVAVLLEQRAGLLEPALQLVLRLGGDGDVDAVDGDGDRQRPRAPRCRGRCGWSATRGSSSLLPKRNDNSTSPPAVRHGRRAAMSCAIASFHATTV